MAIEILEFMDESVVAMEAAKLLRRARDEAEDRRSPERGDDDNINATRPEVGLTSSHFGDSGDQSNPLNRYWGSLGIFDGSSTTLHDTPQLNYFDQNNPMFLFLNNE